MYYGVQTVRLFRDRWFQSTMFWWFASSLPCKQKLMSHHPTKCWRVCYIRYQLGHLGSMLFQAVSSFPKRFHPCLVYSPFAASFMTGSMVRLEKIPMAIFRAILPGGWGPMVGFSTFKENWRKIVLFFFLGHNSKYDSFFLAFQVFAPFTWYKTSLLPESVTVKFDVLCWKKNTCTTMSCWNFMTLGRAWCHRSSFVG